MTRIDFIIRFISIVLISAIILLSSVAVYEKPISNQNQLYELTNQLPAETTTNTLNLIKSCVLLRSASHNESINFYHEMVDRINDCNRLLGDIDENSFERFAMGRFDESKLMLPLAPGSEQDCLWLTVGIGGDTKVEHEVLKKYPKCKIFGIEPLANQNADFAKIGTVINSAVGHEQKRERLIVRLPQGGYTSTHLKVEPLHLLLDQYIGHRLIPFATVDIEGFEYKLLPAFQYDRVFHKEGVTICQLDVEWHGKQRTRGMDAGKMIFEFIRSSDFVPIYASVFMTDHRKITFINGRNEDCRRKFAFDNYFSGKQWY